MHAMCYKVVRNISNILYTLTICISSGILPHFRSSCRRKSHRRREGGDGTPKKHTKAFHETQKRLPLPVLALLFDEASVVSAPMHAHLYSL